MAEPTQYDIARKRAEQQSRGALQSQQDALKRRFASLGAASSGAAIKQEQLAAEKSQEQLQTTQEAIGAQEAAEKQKRADIQEERTFQKGLAEEGRKFAIAEREAAQTFQAGQSQKQMDFQKGIQEWSQSQAGKEFDLALQQFEQDRGTTEFNKRLAALQAAGELGTSAAELLAPGGGTKETEEMIRRRAEMAQGQSDILSSIQKLRIQPTRMF